MFIYNYLFYKSYKLGAKSSLYAEAPVVSGFLLVFFCLILNIYTMFELIDKLILPQRFIYSKLYVIYLYIESFSPPILAGLSYFYYKKEGRWKSTIAKWEAWEKDSIKIHPLIIFTLSIFISMILYTYTSTL